MCGQGWEGEAADHVKRMKGSRQHPGSRDQVAEHGKALAEDQQVLVSPPFHFNPLEVAVPIFPPSSQGLLSHEEAGFWDSSESGIR